MKNSMSSLPTDVQTDAEPFSLDSSTSGPQMPGPVSHSNMAIQREISERMRGSLQENVNKWLDQASETPDIGSHSEKRFETPENHSAANNSEQHGNIKYEEIHDAELPDELTVPVCDALLLHSEEDYERATVLKKHFEGDENLSLKDGENISVLLYADLAMRCKKEISCLETGMKQCVFVFIYVTSDFCRNELPKFLGEECLMASLNDKDKRWCVVPLFSEKKNKVDYKIPFGLNCLKGINLHTKDKFYYDGIKQLIEYKRPIKVDKKKKWEEEKNKKKTEIQHERYVESLKKQWIESEKQKEREREIKELQYQLEASKNTHAQSPSGGSLPYNAQPQWAQSGSISAPTRQNAFSQQLWQSLNQSSNTGLSLMTPHFEEGYPSRKLQSCSTTSPQEVTLQRQPVENIDDTHAGLDHPCNKAFSTSGVVKSCFNECTAHNSTVHSAVGGENVSKGQNLPPVSGQPVDLHGKCLDSDVMEDVLEGSPEGTRLKQMPSLLPSSQPEGGCKTATGKFSASSYIKQSLRASGVIPSQNLPPVSGQPVDLHGKRLDSDVVDDVLEGSPEGTRLKQMPSLLPSSQPEGGCKTATGKFSASSYIKQSLRASGVIPSQGKDTCNKSELTEEKYEPPGTSHETGAINSFEMAERSAVREVHHYHHYDHETKPVIFVQDCGVVQIGDKVSHGRANAPDISQNSRHRTEQYNSPDDQRYEPSTAIPSMDYEVEQRPPSLHRSVTDLKTEGTGSSEQYRGCGASQTLEWERSGETNSSMTGVKTEAGSIGASSDELGMAGVDAPSEPVNEFTRNTTQYDVTKETEQSEIVHCHGYQAKPWITGTNDGIANELLDNNVSTDGSSVDPEQRSIDHQRNTSRKTGKDKVCVIC